MLIRLECLGKPQKNSFLSGRATKRGGGLNGCATKEKRTFFNVREKSSYGHYAEGGGGLKALVAGPQRKEVFFAASLKDVDHI